MDLNIRESPIFMLLVTVITEVPQGLQLNIATEI